MRLKIAVNFYHYVGSGSFTLISQPIRGLDKYVLYQEELTVINVKGAGEDVT